MAGCIGTQAEGLALDKMRAAGDDERDMQGLGELLTPASHRPVSVWHTLAGAGAPVCSDRACGMGLGDVSPKTVSSIPLPVQDRGSQEHGASCYGRKGSSLGCLCPLRIWFHFPVGFSFFFLTLFNASECILISPDYLPKG